jgi:hypothetical protein
MKLLFEGCFNVGLGAALPDPSVALLVSPTRIRLHNAVLRFLANRRVATFLTIGHPTANTRQTKRSRSARVAES